MALISKLSSLIPQPLKGLSAKLIVLTIFFVMLGEVLIYIPSIARFRAVYLQDKVDAAHLATAALRVMPDLELIPTAERAMLSEAGVIHVHHQLSQNRTITLGSQRNITITALYDLSKATPAKLVLRALEVLLMSEQEAAETYAEVRGGFQDPGTSMRAISADNTVAVTLSLGPLRGAMLEYSWRIFVLSIVMSAIVAMLVFLSLHLMMVRPVKRLTEAMLRFRKSPEDASNVIEAGSRTDEIGLARSELADMQHEIRHALHQRSHLAALGAAVSKISHDLRNTLASAQLVSDRLAETNDPEVARLASKLTEAIDRAITLATDTLKFGRADELSPQKSVVQVASIVSDVGSLVVEQSNSQINWSWDGRPDFEIEVDANHLHRILLNLGRNSSQAIERSKQRSGDITVSARHDDGNSVIQVRDSGSGVDPSARENLFKPFKGSTQMGGTGLGLPIAHELVRANGGTIRLLTTGSEGTTFEITFPKD